MKKIINSIRFIWRKLHWEKKMKQSQLTFKGVHFYNYVKELLDGKNVFIQNYEDDLNRISEKSGIPREILLPYVASLFSEIELNGIPRE